MLLCSPAPPHAESALSKSGLSVGETLLELYSYRESSGKPLKRETRVIGILQFVASVVWRNLFGRNATSLEKSVEAFDEYMIHETSPITNAYVHAPGGKGAVNVAAYLGGIIEGIIKGAGFGCCVETHWGEGKTVFLVKFDKDVMEREERKERRDGGR